MTMHIRLSVVAVAALALGALACSDETLDSTSDHTAPTVALVKVTSSVDTVLSFSANVGDNLGIARVHVDATGGVTAAFDTVFHSA
ncbi:MAG TPA: hypothetical protein VLI40_12005, partial [Gemmatimonadaceae bacterium]|nr:hypothetical protein [Gemmatimonadaceae bacterium]